MRKTILALTALASVAAGFPAAAQQVVSGVGFEGSESARYDAKADRYVVGNLGPRGPGNDGFVSLLGPDGQVIALKWIAGGQKGVGLRDPLGVFVKGETVYVCDTTVLRLFDRATGAAKGSVEIPGAVRLNDVVVGDDGVAYVTDSGSDQSPGALFRVSRDGKLSTFVARDVALDRPNGVAILKDGSIVHGGRGTKLFFRDKTGKLIREQTMPTGQFDGIIALNDGGLLVASQLGHKVYRLPAGGGAPTVVADGIEVPASIGLDTKRHRLLIPQIRAASVTFVDLN